MECDLRYPAIREFELIWLRRLLLPVGALFYGVAFCVAVACWVGMLKIDDGYALVSSLALEGHLIAAIVLAAQALAGDTVLQRLGWTTPDTARSERVLFAIVAGFVMSDVALILLSMFDLLNALTISTLFLGATGASVRASRDPLFRLCQPDRAPASTDSTSTAIAFVSGVIVIAAAFAWLWPLLVQTALPNSDWDSALYHLPLADRYLAGQLWNSDPLFSANSFPGGVSLIYAVLIGTGFESAVIPYNFLFVVLNLLAAYALGVRLGDKRTGAWAILVCSGLHVLWQQGVDPRIDGFLSFFVATAMLGFVAWFQAPGKSAPLYLVAISLGAAIGAKYTGVFIAVAFGGYVVAWTGWQRMKRAPSPTLRSLAFCVVLAVVPNGSWYVANLALHGDPLFPMLRGDYYEDTRRPGERIPMTGALDAYIESLPNDAPERRRARALDGKFESAAPANLFDLVDVYQRPRVYATKPNHFASPLLLLFLFLPLALPKERERKAAALALWSLSGICFLGLASQTNLLRYTLPLLVLFGVASALVISRIRHPLWQGFWIVCSTLVLTTNYGPEMRKLENLRPDLYATSGANQLTWLKAVGYNFTRSMPVVIERINREIEAGTIAPTSVILMAGEGKGRLLECGFLPDLSWFMQRWMVELLRENHVQDEIARSLRRQGVTHILYNPTYFRWVLAHTQIPIPPLAVAMEQLESFMDAHGDPVFELAGMRLVALSGASSTQEN